MRRRLSMLGAAKHRARRYMWPNRHNSNQSPVNLRQLEDRILMSAVDTGWITDERPHGEKLRIAAEGWHAPLDLVDGAARVYDPIVQGEAGVDLFGSFLKDYQPSPW